jgi:hypothetical protein
VFVVSILKNKANTKIEQKIIKDWWFCSWETKNIWLGKFCIINETKDRTRTETGKDRIVDIFEERQNNNKNKKTRLRKLKNCSYFGKVAM